MTLMEKAEIGRSKKPSNDCNRCLMLLLKAVAEQGFNEKFEESLSKSLHADYQVPASCLTKIANDSKENDAILKWFESAYQYTPLEYSMLIFHALANPEYTELFNEYNLVPRFVSVNQNGIIINFAIAGTAITPRAVFCSTSKESGISHSASAT